MRPLKHGLLSYVPHLYIRRDTYYYRADIPADIKHYFHTPEIKQSLKTKDSKVAKVLAISMEYRLQRTYAMIRSGMLPFVSDEVWIGKMNSPTVRVDTSIPENDAAVKRILKAQSHQNIMGLYDELAGQEKVRWKESILREVEKRSDRTRVIPIGRSFTGSLASENDAFEMDEPPLCTDEEGNPIEFTYEEARAWIEQDYQASLELR